MRALAIVGLKLMGVSSLFRAAGFITSLASLLALHTNPHSGINPLWFIAQAVAIFGINVLFALVLLFRTEWIVTKLQIPDEPLKSSVSASELLRVGLVIVGVIAMMDALSESAAVLYNVIQNKQFAFMNLGSAVKVLVEFLLAFVVIGKSRRIASRVFSGS